MSGRSAASVTPSYLRSVGELQDNPGQLQAFNSTGDCVVLAGPGSGKTKTLTVKMARLLIEDIRSPRGMACVTYNSECARELTERLGYLGVYESANVFIGTVHSFCLKNVVIPYARLAGIDVPEDLRIALQVEQERLFERALAQVVSANEPPWRWKIPMDRYRRTHVDRDAPGWHDDEQLARLVDRYERLLREAGLIDFDDMILIGLRLIESQPWVRKSLKARFPVLVVDEYQDLGVPLHRIVTSLRASGVRLFAVGDPDQSIYGFTGARPELLRHLSEAPGVEAVRLPFNYRSGPTIIEASEAALGEKRGYRTRRTSAGTVDFYERPDGLEDQARFICEDVIPEAMVRLDGLTYGDIAVLYLDKNDGDVIAKAAADHGIHTMRIDKGAVYSKTPLTRWIEDCARWCAGGWRTAAPRLSDLIARWRSLTTASRAMGDHDRARRLLVAFLLSHRLPTQSMDQWLSEFRNACLDAAFDVEPTLREEKAMIVALAAAFAPTGPLADWTVLRCAGQGGAPDHLNLITLHSAKGLEFRVVILMGMEQGRIPSWSADTQGKREARRLFYVGLTRAEDEVHMTYSGWTQNRYGRRFENGPSEFLVEVRDRLERAGSWDF